MVVVAAPGANAAQQAQVRLSGLVWSDTDFDGLSDLTEPGIADVSVSVWTATVDGAVESLVDTTSTNAQGRWEIDIPAGTYIVEWQAADPFTPTIYGGLGPGQSAVQANGRSEPFTLQSGDQAVVLDAGYVSGTLADRAEISGVVWADTNSDGIKQLGESPINGVTVNIWTADAAGQFVDLIATQTIFDQGRWSQQVQPGSYVVQWSVPPGFVPTLLGFDNHAGPTGTSAVVVVGAGEVVTRDAGFRLALSAELGGFVWSDDNGDGLQDEGESGLADMSINVWSTDANSMPDALLAKVRADADGRWKQPVVPGEYVLQWVTPDATVATFVGTDADDDSDVLPTGLSKAFAVEQGELILRDAGYRPLVQVGGAVWIDENRDGLPSSDESPLPDLTLEIVAARGDAVFDRTVVTGAGGSWSTTIPTGPWQLITPAVDGFGGETISEFSASAGPPDFSLFFGYLADPPPGFVTLVIANDSDTDAAPKPGGIAWAPTYEIDGSTVATVPAGQQRTVVVAENSAIMLTQNVSGIADPRPVRCDGAVSSEADSNFAAMPATSQTIVRLTTGTELIECTFANGVRRHGDVNCDGRLSILDASIIAQFSVGVRVGHTPCPTVAGAMAIHVGAADTNGDGVVNVLDAYRVAQCSVGLTNSMCR